MRKLMIALLLGMLMCPAYMDAKVYKVRHVEEIPDLIPRSPALNQISVTVTYQTGILYVCPGYNVTDLQITITHMGTVLYDDDDISLLAGQTYTTSVADYDEGSYAIVLKNSAGLVIDEYTLTVEDD